MIVCHMFDDEQSVTWRSVFQGIMSWFKVVTPSSLTNNWNSQADQLTELSVHSQVDTITEVCVQNNVFHPKHDITLLKLK